MSQKFDLSTILGISVALLGTLQHFLPDQQWIGMVVAGITAVVLQEQKPGSPSPPTPPSA